MTQKQKKMVSVKIYCIKILSGSLIDIRLLLKDKVIGMCWLCVWVMNLMNRRGAPGLQCVKTRNESRPKKVFIVHTHNELEFTARYAKIYGHIKLS